MIRKLIFTHCLLVQFFLISAQTDSLKSEKKSFLKQQVVPVVLITTGSLLNIGTIKYDIQYKLPYTQTHVEDVFQYVPSGQIFLFDLMGFEHQNSVFDQAKYMAISHAASGIIVRILKNTTKVQRPVGGKTSFVSGHTAMAFVGATALYLEFKDSEPVLAYSGYLFATATGVLRMTNNKHWISDVLAGAGIGILTTNLVYHFEPLKNFQPFKKKEVYLNGSFTPDGVSVVCVF